MLCINNAFCVCVRVCVCVCVCVCVWVHWWLSGFRTELPIKGFGVQGQPVVIWCSVFLLAAVAAVTTPPVDSAVNEYLGIYSWGAK